MKVCIEGSAGELEGALWLPEGPPRAAIVLGHPHPLHGGSMDSSVVFRAGRALQEAGLAVLRLNYRGVGASAGTFHGEGGEVDDHRAALDWLEQEVSGVPLWAGGFSFGARTAAALATHEDRIRQVLLIALPVLAFPCAVADDVRCPGLALMASRDTFGTAADVKAALPGLASRVEVDELEGADHSFSGKLQDLQARIGDWAQRALHTEPSP
ncbi:MAG: alpha/beta fold hydrolase [Planctomycetota bacterium]|nr:alpha/beta fold hydrolase [Planctomycetota bacterium]